MAERSDAYQVHIERRAQRQLGRVQGADQPRIDRRIRALSAQPRSRRSLRLKGNLYRMRIGDWRVFYIVDDRERLVLITDVLRREKDTYDDL